MLCFNSTIKMPKNRASTLGGALTSVDICAFAAQYRYGSELEQVLPALDPLEDNQEFKAVVIVLP